jgi:hypothetical protein
MSVINAILEPHVDGTLHVPVPPELRGGKIRIEARLEAATKETAAPKYGCLAGKIFLAPDFDEPLEDFGDYMK